MSDDFAYIDDAPRFPVHAGAPSTPAATTTPPAASPFDDEPVRRCVSMDVPIDALAAPAVQHVLGRSVSQSSAGVAVQASSHGGVPAAPDSWPDLDADLTELLAPVLNALPHNFSAAAMPAHTASASVSALSPSAPLPHAAAAGKPATHLPPPVAGPGRAAAPVPVGDDVLALLAGGRRSAPTVNDATVPRASWPAALVDAADAGDVDDDGNAVPPVLPPLPRPFSASLRASPGVAARCVADAAAKHGCTLHPVSAFCFSVAAPPSPVKLRLPSPAPSVPVRLFRSPAAGEQDDVVVVQFGRAAAGFPPRLLTAVHTSLVAAAKAL